MYTPLSTQDVNWTYIRRSEGVQDVFWTSYVRSIYVFCLLGPTFCSLSIYFRFCFGIYRIVFASHLHKYRKGNTIWLTIKQQSKRDMLHVPYSYDYGLNRKLMFLFCIHFILFPFGLILLFYFGCQIAKIPKTAKILKYAVKIALFKIVILFFLLLHKVSTRN